MLHWSGLTVTTPQVAVVLVASVLRPAVAALVVRERRSGSRSGRARRRSDMVRPAEPVRWLS